MDKSFGYIRTASVKPEHAAEQRKAIEKWASRHDRRMPESHTYTDIGVSGTTKPSQRAGFLALLKHLAVAGGNPRVVVTDFDRISRLPEDLVNQLEALGMLHCTVHLASEDL